MIVMREMEHELEMSSFTPEIDRWIIEEYPKERETVIEKLTGFGFSPQKVHEHAVEMGLTKQAIAHHHTNEIKIAARQCLYCDQYFASHGHQNRLCRRCRFKG